MKITYLGYLLSLALWLKLMSPAFGQNTPIRLTTKQVNWTGDTLLLDTLMVVPGSASITNMQGDTLGANAFSLINYHKIWLDAPRGMYNISYSTLAVDLSKPRQHKQTNIILKDAEQATNPFSYQAYTSPNNNYRSDRLSKNGSISRGISLGNNQDVVVNSNLNLQISGKLTDQIDILLAATDNNIPIQPEGNTQQLQDFDKVYIQLSDKRTNVIAGDFPIFRPESYFLNFNKKAQGLSISNNTLLTYKDTTGILSSTLNAAVSRGKFGRNIIQGVEGNQGPYRLTGAENEPFIIILSGTEKVFIDGLLLERGQDKDYIIDYNTAEITFTPKQFITKDKRIIVEFQYSDKNYARSLYHFGTTFSSKESKTWLHFYSEQDSKNKPLQQDLSNEQKLLLINIGDSLDQAISSGVDSVGYNESDVLYEQLDSTVGSFTFTEIYKYSTNPEKAKYRLAFSFVGANNGNYTVSNSSANGRVYKWTMPDTLTGKPTGSYEPVILLVSPKQKQVFVIGNETKLGKSSALFIEGALSKNDLNTFSKLNSNDDNGYALKLRLDNNKILREDSALKTLLSTQLGYEYIHKNFNAVERFRPVEFERDWNRPVYSLGNDQHLIHFQTKLLKGDNKQVSYNFNTIQEKNFYRANKHSLNVYYDTPQWLIDVKASYLDALDSTIRSRFIKEEGNVLKRYKKIGFGIKTLKEQNSRTLVMNDSLLNSGFDFFQWEGYIINGDTSKNTYELSYLQRTDYGVNNNQFERATFAESVSFSTELFKKSVHRINARATYRTLTISDTNLTLQKPDESMTGRIEYRSRPWKGFIIWHTFYEAGSGLELRKEFSFLEVPPGQGAYAWTDYNENGIKELNEFEVAIYSDQARYIKVFTPTNNYIKTYSNQFTQSINFRPAVLWSGKKGIKKAISKLSNQVAFQSSKKSANRDANIALNPLPTNINDTALVSQNTSIRNTLFINQGGRVFSSDIVWQDAYNKSLLVNGLESRSNLSRTIKTRLNISKKWSTVVTFESGNKSNNSEFFSSRNYYIKYIETSPSIIYQPSNTFRSSLQYRYATKSNHKDYGGQEAIINSYGIEMRYNVLKKGSLVSNFNFIEISYNDDSNTSIAFEMLESLKAGKNFTWNLLYQRTLSNNMQVNLNYNGRSTEGNKTIHSGGIQVRAFF